MLTTFIRSARRSCWTFLFIIFTCAIAGTIPANKSNSEDSGQPEINIYNEFIKKTCPSLYNNTDFLPAFCPPSKLDEDPLCRVIFSYRVKVCETVAKKVLGQKTDFSCSQFNKNIKIYITNTEEIIASLKNSTICKQLCSVDESRSKCQEIALLATRITEKEIKNSKPVPPKAVPIPEQIKPIIEQTEPTKEKKPIKNEVVQISSKTPQKPVATTKSVETKTVKVPVKESKPDLPTEKKEEEEIKLSPVPEANKVDNVEEEPLMAGVDQLADEDGETETADNMNSDKVGSKVKLGDFNNPDKEEEDDTGDDLSFNSGLPKDDEAKIPGPNSPSRVEALDNSMFGEQMSTGNAISTEDSHFFVYFLTFTCLSVMGYIGFHNKNKILALALEGRRGRGGRRRPNSASYRKLDTSLEEAMMSHPSSAPSTHVIY